MKSARRKRAYPQPAIGPTDIDLATPSPVRIVDHCLAMHGWSRSARIKILRAIKDGVGDDPFTMEARELTDSRDGVNSTNRHVERCLETGEPGLAWPNGMSSATRSSRKS